MYVPQSQSDTNVSAVCSDFTLTSTQDSNPFSADGIRYRDQENELRFILGSLPYRSPAQTMTTRNNSKS